MVNNVGPEPLCGPPTLLEPHSCQHLDLTLRRNSCLCSASVLHTPHQLPTLPTLRKHASQHCVNWWGWARPTSIWCQLAAQPPFRPATYDTLFCNCSSSCFTCWEPRDECSVMATLTLHLVHNPLLSLLLKSAGVLTWTHSLSVHTQPLSMTSHPSGRICQKFQERKKDPSSRRLSMIIPEPRVPPHPLLSYFPRRSWAPSRTWYFGQETLTASMKVFICFSPFTRVQPRNFGTSWTFSLTNFCQEMGTLASKTSYCSN